MNISSVGTIIKGFNKAGCRVSYKKVGQAAKELFSGIPVPKGAETMDIVQIQTHNGDGLKSILQYKDREGKLVQSVMKEYKDNEQIGLVIRDYERSGKITRTFTSKFDRNNKETERIREAISVRFRNVEDECGNIIGTQPHAIRTKLNMSFRDDGSRAERQVYEHLQVGGRDKWLETTAVRGRYGALSEETLDGNIEKLEELANDPYLHIRNYSMEDFFMSARQNAVEEQNLMSRRMSIKNEKIDGNTLGTSGGNKVRVDVEKHKDNRAELVDTLNHELRHQYQASRSGSLKDILFRKDRLYDFRCWLGDKLYFSSGKNHLLYYLNFLERDARAAGRVSSDRYKELSIALGRRFDAKVSQAPIFGIEPPQKHFTFMDYVKVLSKPENIRKLFFDPK